MMLRQRAVVILLFVALASGCAAAARADVVEDQRKTVEHENSLRDKKRREEEQKRDTERRTKAAIEQQKHATAAAIEQQKHATAIATQAALETAVMALATNLTSPPPAQVVAVNPQFTTLDGGRNAGVARGDTVQCFARGQPIIRGGKQIAFDETLIGEGTVSAV